MSETGPFELPLVEQERIDALCDRYEHEWLAGRTPRVESYLEGLAGPAWYVALEELLSIELAYLRQAKRAVDFSAYTRRFPGAAAVIQRLSGAATEESLRKVSLAAGDALGKYLIVSLLGTGGMGAVYRAVDTVLNRQVAIKVLLPRYAGNPLALSRLKSEALALAAINHPNILTVHEVCLDDDLPYTVLELLEGETLAERLQRGRLPETELWAVSRQLARGLAVAHTYQIVHRDLKPQNIFLTHHGQVKILDFGLARLGTSYVADAADRVAPASGPEDSSTAVPPGGSPLTQLGTRMGTAGYMAPEQVRGEKVDERSDIFSFGCVLFEMLHGSPPFLRATARETDQAILFEDPANVPSPVVGHVRQPAWPALLGRCLAKRPEDRYASAVELAAALDRMESRRRRPAWRWAEQGLLLVALVTAAILAAALWRTQSIKSRIETLAQEMPDIGPGDEHLDELRRSVRALYQLRETYPAWQQTMMDVIRGRIGSRAHFQYVMGFLRLEGGTRDDLDAAVRHFEAARQLDPLLAAADVGIGQCYYRRSNVFARPSEMMPRVLEFVESARNKNPQSSAALTLLALYEHRYLWDWARAEQHFRQAESLPGDRVFFHQMFGNSLVLRRRFAEGVEHLQEARRLDPDSAELAADLGLACYLWGSEHAVQADQYLRDALSRDPECLSAWWGRAELAMAAHDYGHALDHYARAYRREPQHAELLAEYIYCSGRAGERSRAERLYGDLNRLPYVPQTARAVALLGLGRTKQAWEAVRRGVEERDEWLVWLDVDPVLADFRQGGLLVPIQEPVPGA